MVKTIPPLKISRPKRGVAPFQNVISPSSLKIFTKQSSVPVYSLSAPRPCIRVLTVSIGIVVYTVTTPAKAPSRNVSWLLRGSFGFVPLACCRSVLKLLYAPSLTAEFDPCLRATGTTPW
ncbi:hypothetical protein OGATHE_006134 [Ogataea polymorpha]|uniref:Uncharacterized protein n=1 Tax=Ogataea polymorpha TaxID=460523 RepID=A0A9P8NT36_9ASCO|nr:hypothetical protein OGATHE_006134 [Ogataea polymorpha]